MSNVIRQFFRAYNDGDLDSCMNFLTEDVVFDYEGGRYDGKKEVLDFLKSKFQLHTRAVPLAMLKTVDGSVRVRWRNKDNQTDQRFESIFVIISGRIAIQYCRPEGIILQDYEQNSIILCVDDDREITELLFDVFCTEAAVLTADSALEALDMIDRHIDRLSVIICDDRMPGMNGITFFSRLKQIFPENHILKIIYTGHFDIGNYAKAIQEGFVDQVCSKNDSLLTLVSEVVRRLKTPVI